MPEDEEECEKEVTYAYIVTNVGSTAKTIDRIERDRDGDTVDITMLADRLRLEPGEFAIARELRQKIDFCIQRLVTTGKGFQVIIHHQMETFCLKVHPFFTVFSCDYRFNWRWHWRH